MILNEVMGTDGAVGLRKSSMEGPLETSDASMFYTVDLFPALTVRHV